MQKKLTLSAVITAISTLFLYICCIVPSGKIALFALATAFLCITVSTCGVKYALISAAAVAGLSFIFVPNKLILIPYIILFGYYPILKLYIEKIGKLIPELLLKAICAAAALFLCMLAARLFRIEFILPFHAGIVFPAAIVIFLLYDIALSLFIAFYRQRIAKHIKL